MNVPVQQDPFGARSKARSFLPEGFKPAEIPAAKKPSGLVMPPVIGDHIEDSKRPKFRKTFFHLISILMIDIKQTNKSCLRWKGKQRRIGITGGIASGKTLIGDYIFQTTQWPILDADLFAHEALEPESLIFKKVLVRYGDQIIQKTNNNQQFINRKALAKIIFQNNLEKNWLEKVIHPFVNKRIKDELKKFNSSPVIVLIIPLLFEQGYTNICSEILYIDCPRLKQIERLQARDNLSIDEANQRIDAQWENSFKKQFADLIINNSKDDQSWKKQLKKLHKF